MVPFGGVFSDRDDVFGGVETSSSRNTDGTRSRTDCCCDFTSLTKW